MAIPASSTETDTNPLSGVGVSSIAGIKAAVAAMGFTSLKDTNDYDAPSEGGGGYHATFNAVDWSNGGDSGTPQMDGLAAAIVQQYGPYSLEIIHVNQDGTMIGWSGGKQVNALAYFGAATMAQHRNHVHWAITNPGLVAGGAPVTATDVVDLNPLNWPKDIANAAGNAVVSTATSAASAIFKPFIEYAIEAGMVLGGGILLLLGFVMLAKSTSSGSAAINGAAQVAVMAAA